MWEGHEESSHHPSATFSSIRQRGLRAMIQQRMNINVFFKKSSINNLHILIAEEDKIVTGVNAAFKAVTYMFSDIKGSFFFFKEKNALPSGLQNPLPCPTPNPGGTSCPYQFSLRKNASTGKRRPVKSSSVSPYLYINILQKLPSRQNMSVLNILLHQLNFLQTSNIA